MFPATVGPSAPLGGPREEAQAVRTRLARWGDPAFRRWRWFSPRRLDRALPQSRGTRRGAGHARRALRPAAGSSHLRPLVRLLAQGPGQPYGRPTQRGDEVRRDPSPGGPRVGSVRTGGPGFGRRRPSDQVPGRTRSRPLGQFDADPAPARTRARRRNRVPRLSGPAGHGQALLRPWHAGARVRTRRFAGVRVGIVLNTYKPAASLEIA